MKDYTNDMNIKLRTLYDTIPQDLIDTILDFNAERRLKPNAKGEVKVITKPFWISVPDEYAKAKHRILMINQETYGWHHSFRIKPVDDLMHYYADFIENNVLRSHKPSPVWVKFRKLRDIALAHGSSIIASNIGKIGYVWESAYRYGCRGFKKEDVNFHPWINDVFFKEIEILAPDIIIFFTGPDYDEYIIRRFLDQSFETPVFKKVLPDIDTRRFAVIRVNGFPAMYRTYHPAYLQRSAKEVWAKAVNAYIEHLVTSLDDSFSSATM